MRGVTATIPMTIVLGLTLRFPPPARTRSRRLPRSWRRSTVRSATSARSTRARERTVWPATRGSARKMSRAASTRIASASNRARCTSPETPSRSKSWVSSLTRAFLDESGRTWLSADRRAQMPRQSFAISRAPLSTRPRLQAICGSGRTQSVLDADHVPLQPCRGGARQPAHPRSRRAPRSAAGRRGPAGREARCALGCARRSPAATRKWSALRSTDGPRPGPHSTHHRRPLTIRCNAQCNLRWRKLGNPSRGGFLYFTGVEHRGRENP